MGNGFRFSGQTVESLSSFPSPLPALPSRQRRALPLILFLLTVVTALFAGVRLAQAYAQGLAPSVEQLFSLDLVRAVAQEPGRLLAGVPFALTLLVILLAHELGHYFACRIYGIQASYPYFIPAPNLIGTLGAFIRIRSPIVDRRALFDVGIAGPLVGFLLAVPALAVGIAYSQVSTGAALDGIMFGNPPLVWLLAKFFHPQIPVDDLLLHPIARAAWVGLFATALNLLPVGQLDGGHIVYALTARHHRRLSRFCAAGLLIAGLVGWKHPDDIWPGWAFWGMVLLVLGLRHPAVLDPKLGLDRKRYRMAVVGLLVFLLCFTPVPLRDLYAR